MTKARLTGVDDGTSPAGLDDALAWSNACNDQLAWAGRVSYFRLRQDSDSPAACEVMICELYHSD